MSDLRSLASTAQVRSSQLALEVLLLFYAAVTSALVVRLLFHSVGVDPRSWCGSIVDRVTHLFILPLTLLPGARRAVLGGATVADVTAVGLCLLALIVVAAGRPPRTSRS